MWGYQPLVRLPAPARTPFRELARRTFLALTIMVVNTAVVWIDRGSYADNVNGDGISLIDAFYYATVTVTTTGYGDITPVADHARLLNALVVTPLRIAFLILLVGTTLEVLANEGRRAILDHRWRRRMRNHTVLLGYGTKGRSALQTLQRSGAKTDQIVVIDSDPLAVDAATRDGIAAFHGDVSSRELLRRAEVPKARHVVVTVDRDDTAILATLTVRQLNPHAHVVAAVRESANGSLLQQSGADGVITSSEAVGRLIGLATVSPDMGTVLEDMLTYGEGMEVAQRAVTPEEVGLSADPHPTERVLGVVRDGVLRRFFDPASTALQSGDQVIVVRPSQLAGEPATPDERGDSP